MGSKGGAFNRASSSNAVIPSVNTPYSFSRTLSSDQVQSRSNTAASSRDFSFISTQTTITKLNAEIAKLQAVTAFTKAESEEQILAQREEMIATVEKEEENLNKAEKELRAVREEINDKEEYIRFMHRCNEKQDEALRYAEEERIEIQKILDEISLEHENYRTSANMVDNEISTLMESMGYLLRDQEIIVESSLAFENKITVESDKRIQRLHEMLDAEMEIKNKSTQLRIASNGKKISDTFIEQKEEMKTILDTMNQDRYTKEDELPSSQETPSVQ